MISILTKTRKAEPRDRDAGKFDGWCWGQISETSVMPAEARRTGSILAEALEGSRGSRHLDRDSEPQTYKKTNLGCLKSPTL